jgi:DNA-binding beta-propeller fold protein YncE
MRPVLPCVTAALGVIGVAVAFAGAAASAAAPSPSAAARPGEKVCTIEDERLVELSGLVATDDGYVVINDGTEDESREKIFFLDKDCKVKNAVRYSGGGPLDPEDLALAPDGKTLYIADIGDNPTNEKRPSTAQRSR